MGIFSLRRVQSVDQQSCCSILHAGAGNKSDLMLTQTGTVRARIAPEVYAVLEVAMMREHQQP